MPRSPASARHKGLVRSGWIAALVFAAFVAPGRAATVSDLYSAAAPVQNQSHAARTAAFARNLATVLVKVSGDPAAPESAALAPLLSDAGHLVVEFRYQPQPKAQGGGLELWARFDAKAVDQALSGAGEPIWGKERPPVLAWVLAPAGIVSDDPTDPVARAMRQAADSRGIPLVLPLMDVTDQKQVSAFDVRTLFMPTLKAASRRYGTDTILVGSMRRQGDRVVTQWNLAFSGTQTPFSESAATPAAAASAAVGQAATLLARQLAYVPQGGGPGAALLVVIDGIDSLQSEAAVRRLVAGVQGVQALRLIGVSGTKVRYRLDYAGSAAGFARALALSGSLTQTGTSAAATVTAPAAASAAVAAATELDFRYTP